MAATNNHYDNWERLVSAVLKKEHLRQIALNPSATPSSASSSFSSSSSFTLCLSETVVIELLIDEQKRKLKALNGLIYLLKLMVPYEKTRVSKANTRSMAMKIAACSPGVESVALRSGKKNQLVVTGEGIDYSGLVSLLRQNVGYAEVISITQLDGHIEFKIPRQLGQIGARMVENILPNLGELDEGLEK